MIDYKSVKKENINDLIIIWRGRSTFATLHISVKTRIKSLSIVIIFPLRVLFVAFPAKE